MIAIDTFKAFMAIQLMNIITSENKNQKMQQK